MTITPKNITSEMIDLCRSIDPTQEPLYVPVVAPRESILCDCFNNTDLKIQRSGGGKQHGWIIWEWPDVFIEAEFHSVWVSPEGSFVDVTPHENGAGYIFFLPDSLRIWNKSPIQSRIKPLQTHPMLLEFLEIADSVQRLRLEYNSPAGTFLVPSPLLQPLQSRQNTLGWYLEHRYSDPVLRGSGESLLT